MSLTACALCHREALRTRWIGGLQATFCDLCGCLYIPEPAAVVGVSTEVAPPRGLDAHAHQSSGPTDPATVSPLSLARTQVSSAH